MLRGRLMKVHLSGAPASLRRYSTVNQEMQTASMRANIGFSTVLWPWLSLTLNSGIVLRHMASVERITSITETREITWNDYSTDLLMCHVSSNKYNKPLQEEKSWDSQTNSIDTLDILNRNYHQSFHNTLELL